MWKKRFETDSSGKAKKSKKSRWALLPDQEKKRKDRLQRHIHQLNEIQGLLLHSACLHQAIAKHYDETIPLCDTHCGECQQPDEHRKAWRARHLEGMAPAIASSFMSFDELWSPMPAYEAAEELESIPIYEGDDTDSESHWSSLGPVEYFIDEMPSHPQSH